MLFRSVSLLALALLFCSILMESAAAQDQRHYAVTDLARVDADFTLQGEYRGSIFFGPQPRVSLPAALQVIARGDGRFDAVLYPGGFPGEGWTGADRVKLSGKRAGHFADLHGGSYRIIVTDRFADVYTQSGDPLGQISKIQRVSGTEGAVPPWGAKILFDGRDTEQFVKGRLSPARLLMEGTQFKQAYRDFTLHIEFQLPYMPYARGQGRSNSGVYLQSRYEVQILDSFGLEGEHNECGGLYKFRKPDANMCYPPLSWQTYDIVFTAPRFGADGRKIDHARLSVYHNGVAIHDNVEVTRKTGGGSQEGPNPLPIKLQDHHNPVRFRNIWIVDDTKPTGSPYPPYARHTAAYQPFGMAPARLVGY